jgi:hypothetical protein
LYCLFGIADKNPKIWSEQYNKVEFLLLVIGKSARTWSSTSVQRAPEIEM